MTKSGANQDITAMRRKLRPMLLEAALLAMGSLPTGQVAAEVLRKNLIEASREPIEVRAQEAAEALTRASNLLAELQKEVRARSAIIERLSSEAQEAEQRADDAETRAALNEEQAKAVDAYLDRAMLNRLTELERSAKRREWSIGTIVALVVGLVAGVGTALILHFVPM